MHDGVRISACAWAASSGVRLVNLPLLPLDADGARRMCTLMSNQPIVRNYHRRITVRLEDYYSRHIEWCTRKP